MSCKKCDKEMSSEIKICSNCSTSTEESNTASVVNNQEYVTATMLQRFLNHLLDGIFQTVLNIVLYIIMLILIFTDSPNNIYPMLAYSVITILISLLYFVIPEVLWQKTLAKIITKTKVVMRDGSKPPLKNILGRTLARVIPFEALSFLFSSYPVGWHDNLSKTLVVPDHYTSDDIKKIDLIQLKTRYGTNKLGIIALILTMFLVGIAIFGILSAVVLASLNTARNKSSVVAITSILKGARIESLIYEQSNKSFVGFCEDTRTVTLLTSASKYSKSTGTDYSCNDSEKNWAISIPLKTSGYLCVDDSSNEPVRNDNNIDTQTLCTITNN